MAKLLIERGHLAMLLSEETQDKAKKEPRSPRPARPSHEAHDAYAKAIEPLNAAYKKFAGFIPEGDPRRAERDQIFASLLDAMLQKGSPTTSWPRPFRRIAPNGPSR